VTCAQQSVKLLLVMHLTARWELGYAQTNKVIAQYHFWIVSYSSCTLGKLKTLPGLFPKQCYKPEGRGFDSQLGEFLNLPNPSGRTRPWGLLSL
jgi:hypothetical protein